MKIIRLNLKVPEDLHRAVRIHCAEEDLTQQEFTLEAIRALLEAKGKKIKRDRAA